MTPATLTVDRLLKSFSGRRQAVLNGVSLAITQGEVVGLIGHSGAGKSTLARCIAGIERAEGGEMLLDGVPLPHERTLEQRRRIQYVWQEPQLALSPYRSALQSVIEPLEGFALGSTPDRSGRAADWLGRMGLDTATMQRRPDGLSGGQCQRVVLARALAAEPDVLLLDEPFSALDTVTMAMLLRLLQQTLSAEPVSVLFVSHDKAAVRRLASRTLQLNSGQISEVSR
jgi:peptide/nickel transport system ATP-binding protein